MHEHSQWDNAIVWGTVALSVLTSEKTLIFMGICFTALRMYITWRNRDRTKE